MLRTTAILMTLALAACGQATQTDATSNERPRPMLLAFPKLAEASLAATHGELRAPMPGQSATVAYFKVDNPSINGDRLVSVSTPVAETVEIHKTVEKRGKVQMRPVKSVKIGAGDTVSFEPGGLHLMLTGLDENIAANDTAPLVLRFERAGEIELVANIVTAKEQMGGGVADPMAEPTPAPAAVPAELPAAAGPVAEPAADQGSHSPE